MNEAEFEKYHQESHDDNCLETKSITRINDSNAKEIILLPSGCNTISQFQSLERKNRNEIVRQLKEQGLQQGKSSG